MKEKTILDVMPTRKLYEGKDAYTLAEIQEKCNLGRKMALEFLTKKVRSGVAEEVFVRRGRYYSKAYKLK